MVLPTHSSVATPQSNFFWDALNRVNDWSGGRLFGSDNHRGYIRGAIGNAVRDQEDYRERVTTWPLTPAQRQQVQTIAEAMSQTMHQIKEKFKSEAASGKIEEAFNGAEGLKDALKRQSWKGPQDFERAQQALTQREGIINQVNADQLDKDAARVQIQEKVEQH